ncbi:MAG: 50S ribosomal protein L10, partial [Candidatus Altiarchaeota archaeon]|nr:50S ribosomal protein L10 [Candidatus Altiarchaeota archaeon]
LKDEIKLRVVKNSIIKLALEKAKLNDLAKHVDNQSAIITTNLNPFKLSALISSCRTKAPAKAGSIAPCDIIVPKGDTPFPAGPVIGDVQKAGIKAKIQGGKIVVTEESLVVKMGGVVPAEAAGILARMGITPFEIGLDLKAAYDGSMVYSGDVLNIDSSKTKANIAKAHMNALGLAYTVKIFTKDTTKLFIQDAYRNAINLAYNGNVYTKETIEGILAKAGWQASALSALVKEPSEKQ